MCLSFHLELHWDWTFILFALVLTLIAVIGKFVGSALGLAVYRRNVWESTVVGFGMNGRGAVELVVASVIVKLSNELLSSGAITDPLLTQQQFSALIIMAFITTLLSPICLKWSIMRACRADEKADFCRLWKEG